jgi:hypothetical protein
VIDAWEVWLLLVGFAVGAALVGLALLRLPRAEDDVDEGERETEAEWIADLIERHGGVAATSLVEEVLDLHAAYLTLQRPPVPATGSVAGRYPPSPGMPPPLPPGPQGLPPTYPPPPPRPGPR